MTPPLWKPHPGGGDYQIAPLPLCGKGRWRPRAAVMKAFFFFGLFLFQKRRRVLFRAPARVTFGRSPKSDQKVCLKPKVSRFPARYALAVIDGFVPHGHGDQISSCGQKDRLCVCAAAADLSHGRNFCSYILEQKRQRGEKQRQKRGRRGQKYPAPGRGMSL